MANCPHVNGLAYGCHSVCSQAGLPSLAAREVNCWDEDFSLSAGRSSDYHHLLRNGNTMLDIARSAIQAEKNITKACKAQINTAHCIWVTYVTLRGESYLSSLSDDPDGILLYDPTVKPAADNNYFLRGPLGVQNILFACSADEVELETVRWNSWQDMPFSAGQSIYFDFDVLFSMALTIDSWPYGSANL
ncbi:hypothetical protein VB005_01468 [Metarhizium brunneum]